VDAVLQVRVLGSTLVLPRDAVKAVAPVGVPVAVSTVMLTEDGVSVSGWAVLLSPQPSRRQAAKSKTSKDRGRATRILRV